MEEFQKHFGHKFELLKPEFKKLITKKLGTASSDIVKNYFASQQRVTD
jgi:hypothetical protein